MTTMTLHRAPEWREVGRQQLRTTGSAMRRAALVLFAVLLVVLLLIVFEAARETTLVSGIFGFTFEPVMMFPVVGFGLLAAGGVWQREEPSRRAYHLAMPISRVTHTWLRVGAGWVWLMASVAGYMGLLTLLGWLIATIGGGPLTSHLSVWACVAPFAAATTTYLLISIAMVGSEQPLLWIVGAPFGAGLLLALPDLYQWRAGSRMVNWFMNSPFGVRAALWPVFDSARPRGSSLPWWSLDWQSGLVAVLFWTALGSLGIYLAAKRRAPSVR